jgi:hypothetical protein
VGEPHFTILNEGKSQMRHLSSVLLLCLLGCSQGGADAPVLYPVTGSLQVGGKPLADISVQLIPVDTTAKAKTRPGVGNTDAEGKFTIRTNGDKGAISGKYKVVLLKGTAKATQDTIEDAMKKQEEMMQRMKQGAAATVAPADPFPKEWADASTSPKEVEVGNQPVTINIDI